MVSSPGADAFIQFKGIEPELGGNGHRNREIDRGGEARGSEAAQIEDDYDGIVLGHDLARQLGVNVGDRINLLTPTGTLNPFTGMSPRTRPLRVAGIFRLGLYEVDNTFGLVSLEVAARMLNKTQPEMIQLAFDDIYVGAGCLGSASRKSWATATSRRTGRR